MSTVTITLTDHDSGNVVVDIKGLPKADQVPTKAQVFGRALQASINDLRPCMNGMGNNVCPHCDGTCTERNGR